MRVLGRAGSQSVAQFQRSVLRARNSVAPKIAEALIATAIGLVAAIPSVMAYNYFARRVQQLSDLMEGFAADVAARARLGGV